MTTAGIVLTVFAAVFGVMTLVCATLFFRAYAEKICGEVSEGRYDEKIAARMRRTWRTRAAKTVRITAAALVAAAAAFLLIQAAVFRLSDGKRYFGCMALAVASGSMSYVAAGNQIPQGAQGGFGTFSLIFIADVAEEELGVYDIIAFYSSSGDIIIHRIVDVVCVEGENYYVTRGDANSAQDKEAVSYSSIIGAYMGVCVPYLGAAVLFLQSWQGIACVAAAVYLVAIYERASAKISSASRMRAYVMEE